MFSRKLFCCIWIWNIYKKTRTPKCYAVRKGVSTARFEKKLAMATQKVSHGYSLTLLQKHDRITNTRLLKLEATNLKKASAFNLRRYYIMKKFLSIVLAMAMLLVCLFAVSCDQEQEEELAVARSFIAGYEKTIAMGENEAKMSGRVLMNLMTDGTVDIYVGFNAMGSHETAHYTGTYELGENEEFDETISFTYQYGEETASVENAVIIDGIFETPFYMISSMTSTPVSFYETAPVSMDGDIYVGYLTKTGGMGSMVYAYALTVKADGKFDVSIMQMASVMHVWGKTGGTYKADGDKVTFTYDVLSDEGELVTADYVSEGTGFTENALSVGFNISQTTVRASDAPFIKVK